MQLIENPFVIVLHNGEQEIAREVAPPADAPRVAILMVALLSASR